MGVVISRLFDVVFGCKHQLTFPMTRRGTQFTYQTCVRCGAEFEYDWNAMRPGPEIHAGVSREAEERVLTAHPKAA